MWPGLVGGGFLTPRGHGMARHMRRTTPVLSVIALLVAGLPAAAILNAPAAEAPDPLDVATIVRDDFGVAHIYTDSERALWYANGYVQAQDRLWALDLLRHISYGEGASVVGPGGGILAMDLDVRRGLYSKAELQEQFDQAAPEFQGAVEAYTDGVNRAATEMLATGELPAEFPALQHAWHDWEDLDTIAVATFLLARFGNGGGSELGNAKLLAQLEDSLDTEAPMDVFSDINWVRSGSAYPTIPEEEELYTLTPQSGEKNWSEVPEAQKQATLAAAEAESFGLAADSTGPLPGLFQTQSINIRFGSNALLVAPSLSETGEAMVGGGPQMGYFNPQIPYEIGLHLSDGTLVGEGIGVLGAPGVIIGRTANFAWTVTSGISDQIDTVALEAEDGPSRTYHWGDEVRELDCRIEEHEAFTPPAVGGPAYQTYEQEVCFADLSTSTEAVPLAPVVSVTRGEDGEPTWFFAEKSAARMQEVRSAIQWLQLDTAENFEEFSEWFEAQPELDSPGFAFTFNFNFAGQTAAGDEVACYKHVGLQPVRPADLDPRLVTPGGPDWSWEGFLTGEELPWACNPEQGYFANWNNLPQRGWASGDTPELWGTTHRVERLDKAFHDALADDAANDVDGIPGKLNLDQVKSILEQAATHDSLAEEVVAAIQAHDTGTAPAAAAALADWQADDFPWDDMTTNETGAIFYADPGFTVYELVAEQLLSEVFEDELGDHLRSITWDPEDASDPHAGDHGQHRTPFAILVAALEGDMEHDWCDDVTTTAVETCAEQVADAYAATGLDGASEIELTPERRSPFTSLGLGPAYTMPMTNRATFYHFHVGSDTNQSYATLPAGISGHMNAAQALVVLTTGQTPEHMDDQLPLYVDFEFKKLPWSQASAEQGADSSLPLVVPAS